MELITTFQIHFHISSVEVSQELIFLFKSKEGGRTVTSVDHL
jgi:hypothetical protein